MPAPLADTHAHLDYPDFAGDLEATLERARAAGLDRVLTVGTDLASSEAAIRLAERFTMVYAIVGVHPCNADAAPDDIRAPLRALARHPRVAAIGETGLDYRHLPSRRTPDAAPPLRADGAGGRPEGVESADADEAHRSRQAALFEQQLEVAVELGLNVVIHQREAWQPTADILAPYAGKLRAVFHCFAESPERARSLFALDHLVSFTGIVTFKNGRNVQETAAAVPADRFMVETDCPYLAPAPHRGKRCEPAHTALVAARIAELRNTSLDDIAETTSRTARAFFRFAR